MKKNLLSLFIFTFVLCGTVCARTVYDSTNKIIYDDTIRGQRRAAAQQKVMESKIQAAAAAKIDYDRALKALENETGLKSNYNKPVKTIENGKELESNYHQDVTK